MPATPLDAAHRFTIGRCGILAVVSRKKSRNVDFG
jgi:hypothetical protein